MSTYYKSLTRCEMRTYPEGRMVLALFITEFLPSAPIDTISNSLSIVTALVVLTIQVRRETGIEPPTRVVVKGTVSRI